MPVYEIKLLLFVNQINKTNNIFKKSRCTVCHARYMKYSVVYIQDLKASLHDKVDRQVSEHTQLACGHTVYVVAG